MPKGLRLLSLLLLATSAHAAVDNQIIKSEAASAITLAGRIGEAAMYSVQADDDDDLEIFATASSKIDAENDHWLLLDWDGTDYKIVKNGILQPENYSYLSSLQLSDSKLLLGQKNGKFTTIEFSDDLNSDTHVLTESQSFLSELNHEVDGQVEINTDIKAIVKLEGTDQASYTVLCSTDLIHILNSDTLEFTLEQGGYCQAGNVDYSKTAQDVYDQELITQDGFYFNFDGASWIAKESLSRSTFGGGFKVANIDDDDAQEILSQEPTNSSQLQSFSATGLGPWVYISAIQEAKQNFSVIDIDGDGYSEILFDYVTTTEEPHAAQLNKVVWDTAKDSHVLAGSAASPYLKASNIKRLPTTLINGTYGGYFLFASNGDTANPTSKILYRLDEGNLSTDWSGIYSTALRSFDGIARTQNGDTISDYSLVQLEQIDLGKDNYEFAYKFLDTTNLLISSVVEPDFADDEMSSVDSFIVFDLDQNGVDELHAGGQATYTAKQGIVLSSNLDGSDHYKLVSPDIESVTALYIGDSNSILSPDIIATGKNTGGDGGIGIQLHYDSAWSSFAWFKPGSGDTDFKKLISSNIKGSDKPEILGLHSQLASYNPNAGFNESSLYNLSNMDLDQFTPITLVNRDYDFALASDATGLLYLIEPKDFDILASIKACDTPLSAISNVRINNNLDVALAICGQQLLSWVVEYDPNIQDYGYSLYALASHDLGNVDTSIAKLVSIETSDLETHLFTLLKNKLHRYLLNKDLGLDGDSDGTFNYKDLFPIDATQWADSDLDGLGDNPAPANNPDPSLNDIDNDGVLDNVDPDNNPENDFDTLNDSDNGLPSFTNTPLSVVKAEFDAALTSVSITAPAATDIYDDFVGNGSPTINATNQNDELTEVSAGKFEANLAPGIHTINWRAQDVQGNSTSTSQEVWVYPSIAFETPSQRLGENQTAQIKLVLSGTSPEYPVTVNLSTSGSATAGDVTEDISSLNVSFAEGEIEKILELSLLNDAQSETDETLVISITDDFNSAPNNESWTVDASNNNHTVTIADINIAPTFIDSSITQNGLVTTTPNNVDGSITLAAAFNDTNISDSLSYFWDLSSLNMPDSLLPTASFSSTSLSPGQVYSIIVTATDNGLPSIATQQMILLNIVYGDTDNDTFNDNVDAFPFDSSEWLDSDNDNVGNNTDLFNDDPTEWEDSDNDNVGDNADPFDDDPTEWEDTDGDNVGNNTDLFNNDATEWEDTDGDGVGNNADPFDDDVNEWEDTDGDGVGNNADLFDDDANEWDDTDGDGVGDNSDDFPNDANKSRKLDDQSLEDSGAGSLHYLLMLMLMTLMLYRRKA